MLLFCALVLFFDHSSGKDRYALDESLKIKRIEPIKVEENVGHKLYARSLFSIVCPPDFINNGTHCVQNGDSTGCEDVTTLNYSIEPFQGNSGAHDNLYVLSNCSYGIEEILAVHSEEGFFPELQLFFDTITTRPYKLYLDVTTRKPINNIESKIFCWSCRYQTKSVRVTEVFANISGGETRRFALSISDVLSRYFCHFLYPTKTQPVVSNFVSVTNNTIYTFRVKVNGGQANISRDNNVLIDNRYAKNAADNYSNIIVASNETSLTAAKREILSLLVKYELVPNEDSIFRDQFCPGSTENIRIRWPETERNNFAYPVDNICLDSNDKLVFRKCHDTFFGPKWSGVTTKCSDKELRETTKTLLEMQKGGFSDAYLSSIADILTKNPNVQDADLFLITNILTKTLYFDSAMSVIDKVLDINPQSLTENTIHRFFRFTERYTRELLKNNTECRMTYKNIKCLTAHPFLNKTDYSGYEFNITNVKVYFSEPLLNSINISREEQNRFVLSAVVFERTKLFSNAKIAGKMIDLNFMKSPVIFEHSLSIRFKNEDQTKLKCVYWDKLVNKWTSLGVSTKYISPDVVECRSYHLTRFSLLLIPDDVVDNETGIFFGKFDLFSNIECGVSILGVLIIIIIAMAFPEWRRRRWNVIHLSFVILLELSALVALSFKDNVRFAENYCLHIGASLQLLVLVKFFLMLLIAKTQVENFVNISKTTEKIKGQISHFQILSPWLPSIFIVTVSAVFFPKFFQPGKFGFCYPQQELFLFSVALPAGVIGTINSFALLFVMVKVFKVKKAGKLKKRMFRIKLAALLWFLMGGVFVFSTLVNIFPKGALRNASYYIFCFVAPLQGFVIFVFYVVLDRNTKLPWFSSFKCSF